MNQGIIIYMLGWIMNTEVILMTLPVVTAAVHRENVGLIYPDVVVIRGLLDSLYTREKPCTETFFAKGGFVMVSLGRIVLSFFGCIPFITNGEIPRIIDATFEIVSGFTTIGSNIIPKVEDMSHTTLMWRSFPRRIGGMGILVFVLAILPMTRDYNMHIIKAESLGLSVGKLVPKVQITVKLSYSIYFCMTVVMMVLLLFGKMPLFDNIYISFETAGTGGFAYRNSKRMNCTMYQQAVITISVLLFGVNFNVHYLLLIRRPKDVGRCGELRGYLAVVAIAVLLTTINIQNLFPSLFMALHQTTFQVSSIITTTEYSTIDYSSWSEFSKIILLLIVLIGARAGSTGGGTKASRVMITFKEIRKGMASVIHPHSMRVLKFERKPLEYNILRSLNAYIIVCFMIFGISILIVSLDNYDFMTSFSAVATNSSNVDLGMFVVSPSSNYSMVSHLSKTVLIFDMLARRLELLPMLVFLSPGTWRRS